jgi:hypothetical protein
MSAQYSRGVFTKSWPLSFDEFRNTNAHSVRWRRDRLGEETGLAIVEAINLKVPSQSFTLYVGDTDTTNQTGVTLT